MAVAEDQGEGHHGIKSTHDPTSKGVGVSVTGQLSPVKESSSTGLTSTAARAQNRPTPAAVRVEGQGQGQAERSVF